MTLEEIAKLHGGIVGQIALIHDEPVPVRSALCPEGLIYEQDGIAVLLNAATIVG